MAKLKGTTYSELDRFLPSADRSFRTIGNNTTAERDGFTIVVALHGHDIVRLFPSGDVRVCDGGGYQSVTTKERINQFLPMSIRVFQRDYVWLVSDRRHDSEERWDDRKFWQFDTCGNAEHPEEYESHSAARF